MQNQIPKNWQVVRADELCVRVTDGTHDTPTRLSFSNHPLITSKQLKDGVIEATDYFISDEDFSEVSKRSKVDQWDLLFGMIGTVGDMVIVRDPEPKFAIKNVGLFKTGRNKEIAKWLYYYFKSPIGKSYLKSFLRGTSQGYIPLESLRSFPIIVPETDAEIGQIISILSAFDDKIEVNNKIAKTLEEMAQAIFKEWFALPSVALAKDGKLPQGWEIKNIGQILNYYIGGGWGSEKTQNQFQVPAYVIRGTDIPSGRYGSIEEVPLRYHKNTNFNSRKLIDKDIVFEVSGGSKDQPVGRALFINQTLLNQFKQDVICASFCKLLRIDKNILPPEIVYLHLIEIYKSGKIYQYQVQSTGISNFKFESFLNKEIILIPDKETKDQFSEIIEPLFNQIQMLGSMNTSLKQTRDLLLPKLMRGEIKV